MQLCKKYFNFLFEFHRDVGVLDLCKNNKPTGHHQISSLLK